MKRDAGWLIKQAALLILGAAIGIGGFTLSYRERPAPIRLMPAQPTPSPAPTSTPGPIRVYVNGAVANPAVYELPFGSIVEQAIQAAGGFTPAANTAVVNLAQPLSNGVHIYVPALDERVALPSAVVNTPLPGGDDPDLVSGSGSSDLININLATLSELDTLPGIGPATAQKILDYREAHGPFQTIAEITEVSGIGEAKFAQIEALITVEGN